MGWKINGNTVLVEINKHSWVNGGTVPINEVVQHTGTKYVLYVKYVGKNAGTRFRDAVVRYKQILIALQNWGNVQQSAWTQMLSISRRSNGKAVQAHN